MLAELVEKLVSLGRATQKIETVPMPGDPRTVIVREGSEVERVTVPPPLRAHKISAFPDFVQAVAGSAGICTDPQVFFGETGAVAYVDRKDRREFVTMPLEYSERWAATQQLAKGVSFTPKEAINFLRFSLNCASAEPVIQGLRKIDFTRTSAGRNVNEHGRESLGKSVEAVVQQADAIPESFTLNFQPLVNYGLRLIEVSVRVGVAIDHEQQRIVFRLLADGLTDARESMLRQLGEALTKSMPTTNVFQGTIN